MIGEKSAAKIAQEKVGRAHKCDDEQNIDVIGAPELKSSITFDNGSEFACHGLLASVSGMNTWFCGTYAS